ncbi:hypothetical protein L226DRAFT_329368 [Lentinus tigrinus ALCF2SS1-7]|uniref:Uncharacterized protein n=1 Tax=Lentinus tigrinus ALCF2SS1-6 TaxID=1328759 RepID=A0A5C2SFK9_9APHY|nr:hypothetical protein L227DRAFT_429197 [Lentinus tigrinus ALCF2SS1-6]RPD77689.1 hypothetical protein L226DRAFT_329368 [Lentinus tigrinus ALCF2SS1-7]
MCSFCLTCISSSSSPVASPSPYPAIPHCSIHLHLRSRHWPDLQFGTRLVPSPHYLRLRASGTCANLELLRLKHERVLSWVMYAIRISTRNPPSSPLLCPASCQNESEATHACSARRRGRVASTNLRGLSHSAI